MPENPILIIPCSGIGKPFGTISRDATFRVVDDLRKVRADTNCLKKNIEIAAYFRVMDLLRENRGLRPRQVTFLDEDGLKLSEMLAEKIASKVDELGGGQP